MAKRWRIGGVVGLVFFSAAGSVLAQAPVYPDPAPIQRTMLPASTGGTFPGYGGMPAPGCPSQSPSGSGLILPGHVLYPPGFPLYSATGPAPYGAYPDDGAYDEPLWYSILSGIFSGNHEYQPTHQLTLGWAALRRERLKPGVLAVQDPDTVDDPDVPVIRPPTLLDAHDMNTSFIHGMKASLRVFGEENDSTEFAVTYLPNHHDSITVAVPGRVNGLFFNFPIGFEGNNVLWDNADFVRLTLSSVLISAELNKRWAFGEDGVGGEIYVGVRYTYFRELLGLTFDDDSLAIAPDPTEFATYYVRARNHLVYGQLGIDLQWHVFPWLAVSWEARGAWGGDRTQTQISLVRGDGLLGRQGYDRQWAFTQNYETGLFLHVNGSFWRLRGGWSAYWLVGVNAAQNQIDFNLENTRGRSDIGATIFYHGPSVLLEFVY